MTETSRTFLAALNRFIDWFIPASIAGDRELLKQARIFLISHLFGPFIGNVIPLALYVLDPMPGYQVAVLAASITGFWIFPLVLRAVGHYYLLALISIENLIFCILWSCFFYGGITSPTLPWVLSIPLLAFFYLGSAPRLRLVVLAMFAVNFAVFFWLIYSQYAPPVTMDFAAIQGLGLVSTICASLYVAMMALFYARVLASQSELESEMKLHMATAVELKRATEQAERASAAKADFLAKMTHELRTPLNAVIGFSQLLIETATEENDVETLDDLERIHGAGQHLLKLVNEILDLSKIEAKKMPVHNRELRPLDLAEEAVLKMRTAAERKALGLVLAPGEDPGSVVADSGKLRHCLEELIDNATRFTETGQITVSVWTSGRRGERRLFLAVRDTGPGISAARLPKIFERFAEGGEAEGSGSMHTGTGLGLGLSRKLCQLMRGDIVVESKEGRGTTFVIVVPASPEDAAVDPSQAAAVTALSMPVIETRNAPMQPELPNAASNVAA